ncbi:hypothetical protein EHF_0859 [Ehrlichia japonica]|uniref:Uncharacterized protein n=2 Tax=Ehrlichia japonica TaxID=391036 RepID=X5GJV5_9RICK|nr:hypothetical protein EHF_0859 [Ehrlichia japonica]
MTVNETSSNQEVAQNKISILNAYSVNFVQRDNTIFSAYYVKRAFVGHDLICEIYHGNSTYHVKVNDNSILSRAVKDYLPEMLLVKGVDNDFLIIVLSEGVLREYKIKSTISLKIYKVRYLPNITLFDMGKIPLSSSVRSLKEEVKYPVVLYQNQVDTVVIVGRVDSDDRAKLPDRFYVMWRMQYHDNKFQLIKPITIGAKFNSRYLFKYSGYIGYGKYSDKLIMVSEFKRRLSLLYVGKYLSSDHKFFSSIYEISVDYNLDLNIGGCLINHRYGCNLSDDARYHIPVSGIDVISAIRNGEDTYVAYVGVVPDGKFKDNDQLVVAHSKAGNQLSIYDFMQMKEHITSLYLKHIGNSIVITVVGSDNMIKYGIPELQLKSGNITHIDVIQFSRHEVTNIADFVNVVTQDMLFEDAYAKVNTVEAKKTYNNYMVHMSFSIREVQSKNIFTTMQSHISTNSVNMSVYEVTTPTPYMTAYDLLKESEGLQEVTSNLNSTAKVNVKHMTTESLSYVSSGSKKETTLYYGSHVIPSTTQSIILNTDSTKSSVGNNTTDFVDRVLVSTNRNHNVSSVTKIPVQSTTVKRAKFTTGKKYIGNASDVEYGISNKKAKYGIRSTTQSSFRSKSTLRRHVFYDEDFETTSNYAGIDRLNLTTTISRSDSFSLTNDSISRNKTYFVDYNSGNHGLLVGAIFIVGFIVMLFVGIFYNKFGCNRLRQSLTRCVGRSSRGNTSELQVFELRDRQEIAGVQIPNRMAY